MLVKQEILLTFRDETGELKAIAEQNGHTTFHWVKHMNKDDVAELLGVEKTK